MALQTIRGKTFKDKEQIAKTVKHTKFERQLCEAFPRYE